MFPLVHPGIAYLAYSGYLRFVDDEPSEGLAILVLAMGSVIPDLVDQSLHYLGSAPNTRTVAHSMLAGAFISTLVFLAINRFSANDRLGIAFLIGYLSHLLADAVWPVVLWIPAELRYLGWPVMQQPPYDGIKPLGTVGGVFVTTLWVELGLLAVATVVWWRDGRPGFWIITGVQQER